jgi:hypothetical protein
MMDGMKIGECLIYDNAKLGELGRASSLHRGKKAIITQAISKLILGRAWTAPESCNRRRAHLSRPEGHFGQGISLIIVPGWENQN